MASIRTMDAVKHDAQFDLMNLDCPEESAGLMERLYKQNLARCGHLAVPIRSPPDGSPRD
jgi:hypothetical protein